MIILCNDDSISYRNDNDDNDHKNADDHDNTHVYINRDNLLIVKSSPQIDCARSVFRSYSYSSKYVQC